MVTRPPSSLAPHTLTPQHTFPGPSYLWYECAATFRPIKAECWLCAAPCSSFPSRGLLGVACWCGSLSFHLTCSLGSGEPGFKGNATGFHLSDILSPRCSTVQFVETEVKRKIRPKHYSPTYVSRLLIVSFSSSFPQRHGHRESFCVHSHLMLGRVGTTTSSDTRLH